MPPHSEKLNRKKLKAVTLSEGRYLLRSNLTGEDSSAIWNLHMRLVEIEDCFRNLKGDLSIRPHTNPDKTQKLIPAQLDLALPEQAPPRITAQQTLEPLS